MTNDTCYILALVKRDDGERMLLGSGYYQFTAEQKHFAPNIFANDVVELQGTDGQLLAGQVRRSASQNFDGYIGDGTVAKTTVEQKRRDFFLFFRKQHHYTVVYIMPDGTAIKRDRGYITDAPAVQELYQLQPKWHIALAFEDVNYYSYAEDAAGNEVYSYSADLTLAAIETGGLVWDANGAVSEMTGLINIQIFGDTLQQGTPTPSSPVAIRTVTGTQTITIDGTNYTVNLGTTELNNLGTYRDRIYKDGDDWKIHKETGSATRDVEINGISGNSSGVNTQSAKGAFSIGNWSWTNYSSTLANARLSANIGQFKLNTSIIGNATAENMEDGTFCQRQGTNDRVYFRFTSLIGKTGAQVRAILAAQGGVNALWGLQTPTDTTITDAGLIAQLDAIAEAMEADGKPTAIVPAGQNLAAIITGEPNGTGGYIFDANSGGGPVNVTVNGVDSATPVWHVYGPCTNPTLTNSTTGEALTWNSTVPSGQELIIDMGAQTATLEGANVFEYVSGSWVTMQPGINRISYTAGNTTDGSRIYWNEVVG